MKTLGALHHGISVLTANSGFAGSILRPNDRRHHHVFDRDCCDSEVNGYVSATKFSRRRQVAATAMSNTGRWSKSPKEVRALANWLMLGRRQIGQSIALIGGLNVARTENDTWDLTTGVEASNDVADYLDIRGWGTVKTNLAELFVAITPARK